MTTQTVSTAVATRDKQTQLIGWLRDQQADIAMAAASHVKPSAIVRVTQGALRRNEKLALAAIANPQSLLYALLDCARLGHEPDTDDYYLVPFGNEVTGIEGYKGIIERMYRAGGVSSVVAQVVRQKDSYAARGQNTPPHHEYDPFASPDQRGPLRGAYAYAILAGDRCSQVISMGRDEVMEHKAKSRGSHKPDSPWQQWEPAMWKKTVLRALEPYVPTSTEYRNANNIARPDVPAHVAAALPAPASNSHSAEPVYDAEIVEDPTEGAAAAPEATAPAATGPDAPHRTQARKPGLDQVEHLISQIMGDWEDHDQVAVLAWLTGPEWTASTAQVRLVTGILNDELATAGGDASKAASSIWARYEKAQAGK